MKKENIVLRIDTKMKTQFKKAVEKEGVSMVRQFGAVDIVR